jgi:hypothetical protein
MRFATPTRIGKRDMKYMVKLERVLFIRITRPLLDKYRCFQLADQRYLFNNTVLNRLGLIGSPQGKTKIFQRQRRDLTTQNVSRPIHIINITQWTKMWVTYNMWACVKTFVKTYNYKNTKCTTFG